MIKKHHFTLIEIILALMVVSIGVMAIMGLIPIGAKAHSNAIHKNHATDAAEQVLNIVAFNCINDWSTYVGPFDDDSESWPTNKKLTWSKDGTGVSSAGSDWGTAEESDGIYMYTKTAAQLYRMLRTHVTKRGSTSTTVNEFDAVFAVWASNVTGPYKDEDEDFHTDKVLETTIRLNVEVSWPGGLEYAKRQKMYFSMEVQQP